MGIGDKSVYLAVGRNPARMLKSVMDANKKESGKVILPFQLSVQCAVDRQVCGGRGDGGGCQASGRDLGESIGSIAREEPPHGHLSGDSQRREDPFGGPRGHFAALRLDPDFARLPVRRGPVTTRLGYRPE